MCNHLPVENKNLWGAEYEKPMRTQAQLYSIYCRLSLAQPQPQNRVRKRDAAQLLFLNVTPLTKNCCSPPCLPLDIKDSLKEDMRLFDGVGVWLKRSCWREDC
jgi:hypothetical protein